MANDAQGIIDNAIAQSNAMASTASGAVESALSRLSSPANTIINDFSVTPISISRSDAGPSYVGRRFESPVYDVGSTPALEAFPLPDYGTPPTAIDQASRPVFVDPTKPDSLDVFSKTAPVLSNILIPPAPSALSSFTVSPPTLTDIVVPPTPDRVVIPEFLATRPNVEITAPSDFAEEYKFDYSDASVQMRRALEGELDAQLLKLNPEYHNQMALLESKLASFMDGGTALPVEVEQAIFNRARDKTNDEYLRTRDGIMVEGSKRGFTIPGGAQFSALSQARQAAADNNARAAIEIAIKQAELEQANMQFAISQSQNLRSTVMQTMTAWFGALIQLNGQGLEYARDLLSASIAVYETLVKVASAQIEIYKAEATVYEVRLKAILAVYDVYQAEIKSLEAQVNVDTARVASYTAQVQGFGALANAYKAVIDGTMAAAELEKLKVDIFQAEVQAYSARVGAKQGEWQGFTAQVQGEAAKQDAFKTQVQAYVAEMEAYSTKIDAYKAQVDAVSSKNESSYKIYNAAISAYATKVEAAKTVVIADTESFKAEIAGYVAQVSADEAYNKALTTLATSDSQVRVSAYDAQIQAAVASASSYNTYVTNASGVAVTAANVYANMAGAALSGMSGIGAVVNSTKA